MPLQSPHHTHSAWRSKFQQESKGELVHMDVAPLIQRFENVALYQQPHRQPLKFALLGTPASLEDLQHSSVASPATDCHASRPAPLPIPAASAKRGFTASKLKRQATKALLQSQHTATALTFATSVNSATRIVPSRFLYDSRRWRVSSRCDYCQFAGGDLECATCNVIAHAQCYLRAYGCSTRKTKGAFVVPTRFSWLCQHCQTSLQDEYDDESKRARVQHIEKQRHIFGQVVTAYVRMTKDALAFQAKKRAIVKIQAAIRGRLARWRFNHTQRMCLTPYAIEGIRVRGFAPHPLAPQGANGTEELRLANGFTCNPYVYVTIVDGRDDDNQLFCFETSLRKGLLASTPESDCVLWPERLFVPGVDGNVTVCFTLLSKNGPNNFFLGQAMLRMRDTDSIWRSGITTELVLADEVEICPRTAQRQLLRLAEVHGALPTHSTSPHQHQQYRQERRHKLWCANSDEPPNELMLGVSLRPFSRMHAHCGYIGAKHTLESLQTSSRWCVLANGVLRIYRHYGVTLASDTIDMTIAVEIKLLEPNVGHHHRPAPPRTSKRIDTGSDTRNQLQPGHHHQVCIGIQSMHRLYLLQCEQREAHRMWLKKLQVATRYSSSSQSLGVSTSTSVSKPDDTISPFSSG